MSKQELIQEDTAFNLVPTTEADREYSFVDFVAVQICFGIAAWFFLTGGLTGTLLTLREAIPVILFGNVVPLLLISPLAVIFARYGVEQFIGSRAIFGHRGADVWFLLYITSSFGWITYAAFLFGQSAIKVVASWNGPEFLSVTSPGAIIFAIIATFLGMYIAWLGPRALKWFMRISALVLMGIILWFIIKILVFQNVPVWDLKPAAPMESLAMSRATAIEYNVGLGFSWAFWYGQWTRLSKSESDAFHGAIWGWGILASTAGIFAAITALVTGTFDPTAWFLEVGGTTTTVLGLILFALANISSIGALVYPLSITLKSRVPTIKWTYAVIIVSAPAIFFEFFPSLFDKFGIYLSIIALLTGIYGGVMVGDYILSRGRYKLRALYDREHGYWYWNGFNLNAFIAAIVATTFYLWTWNPLSGTSPNGLMPYITAGIPSYLIALGLYVALSLVTSSNGAAEGVHRPIEQDQAEIAD